MTDSLDLCRAEIDRIDDALVDLLGKRFRVVDRVIAVKLRDGLPAALPDRIAEVVGRVRARAGTAGVPPDSAEALWRQLIGETIAYEKSRAVKA